MRVFSGDLKRLEHELNVQDRYAKRQSRACHASAKSAIAKSAVVKSAASKSAIAKSAASKQSAEPTHVRVEVNLTKAEYAAQVAKRVDKMARIMAYAARKRSTGQGLPV